MLGKVSLSVGWCEPHLKVCSQHMNWTELTCNMSTQLHVTTPRSLVVRVRLSASRLTAAKLGRLVLNVFQCGCSRSSSRTPVQFMCSEQTFVYTTGAVLYCGITPRTSSVRSGISPQSANVTHIHVHNPYDKPNRCHDRDGYKLSIWVAN